MNFESFIGYTFLDDINLCDELIKYYKNHNQKIKDNLFNIKTLTGVGIVLPTNDEVIKKYLSELKNAVDDYINKYSFCNYYASWDIVENFNLQYYKPNEGFYSWHTERFSAEYPFNNRHLVFMTYLNDVTDAGETEWYHQKLKIKPKKGLTVIWPVDWTFTHRGIPSPTQEKYIITGWYNFTK